MWNLELSAQSIFNSNKISRPHRFSFALSHFAGSPSRWEKNKLNSFQELTRRRLATGCHIPSQMLAVHCPVSIESYKRGEPVLVRRPVHGRCICTCAQLVSPPLRTRSGIGRLPGALPGSILRSAITVSRTIPWLVASSPPQVYPR